MKILAVTNMYPTSAHPAAGTFVEQQIKGLRKIGLEVEVLLLDRLRGGIRVYRQTGQRVIDKLESGGHELVHVMYGGVMADLATRAARDIPTVVTIRGSDILGENLSPLRRLSARFGVLASRRAVRRADRVITVSANLRDALPRDIDRSKVRVIPNGIDLERFRPADRGVCRRELGWAADAIHILFATNGSPVKQPGLARKAVAKLSQRGIRVELHEMQGVAHAEVPVWINASDALLITSVHEGSPNIVKECLACNLPVVSVDVGDVRQRIEGVHGCRIVARDADEIAAGLAAVCASGRRIDGRSRMQALSLESAARRVHEVYLEALTARAVQSPNETAKSAA